MIRFWVALLAWAAIASPAWASGDFTCAPRWTFANAEYTGCDSMAFLAPANDTRVNLRLLLLDRHPGATTASPIGDATPFSWTAFEDALAGKPAGPDDDTSEDVPPNDTLFAAGEGSRCLSNTGGAAGFDAALAASRRLPPAERAILADARKGMAPTCAADSALLAWMATATAPVKSAPGRAFAAYLQGAAAFYDGDFDTAAARFGDLKAAGDGWLRETSRYMLARVEINRAQIGAFDEYGALAPGKVDARILAAAQADLAAYLQDYPGGLYAASARGLMRRVYWLGGDTAKLSAEYVWQFGQADPRARNLADGDLAQEIDAKLLGAKDAAAAPGPMLLAVIDLKAMRHANAGDTETDAPKAAPLSLAYLQAQRPRFASDPALFDYLLAAHAFYDDGAPAEVTRLIPAEPLPARPTYLQFSRQFLRALALDRLGDQSAREAITRLVPVATGPYQRGPVELALALHDERRGEVDRVFAQGSPVEDLTIRGILVRHAAGPALLRARATATDAPKLEAHWPLFVLLYKELTRGDYAAFDRDFALLPPPAPKPVAAPAPADGYVPPFSSGPAEPDLSIFAWSNMKGAFPCPGLREIAASLTRDPRAVRPRLCLGEFVRLSDLDHSALDNPPPASDLGGAPSRFPGANFARMTIYQQVISDPAAAPADKAYALYRAIYCYAPSGNNDCGGPGVAVAQRKAWFELLKGRYASSSWAADAKLYW